MSGGVCLLQCWSCSLCATCFWAGPCLGRALSTLCLSAFALGVPVYIYCQHAWLKLNEVEPVCGTRALELQRHNVVGELAL